MRMTKKDEWADLADAALYAAVATMRSCASTLRKTETSLAAKLDMTADYLESIHDQRPQDGGYQP